MMMLVMIELKTEPLHFISNEGLVKRFMLQYKRYYSLTLIFFGCDG